MSVFISRKLPKEAHELESIQKFEKICNKAARRLPAIGGSAPATFDPNQTQAINNRSYTDGIYRLENRNPAEDFFCQAKVNTFSGELDVEVGLLSQQSNPSQLKGIPLTILGMKDQCTLTRSIAGEEELGGRQCHDGAVDPKLAKAFQDPALASLRMFEDFCGSHFENYSLKLFGSTQRASFSMDRVTVDRATANPGFYTLKYERPETLHPENAFYCQAEVDQQAGMMYLVSGEKLDPNHPPQPLAFPMQDVCSQTEALDVPYGRECEDQTLTEKRREALTNGELGTVGAILGAMALYSWGRQGLAFLGMPLAKKLGWNSTLSRLSHWRLPFLYKWRGGLNLTVYKKTGERVAYLSNIDKIRLGAASPTAPWHRASWFLTYGAEMLRRTAGPAMLFSTVYDAIATQFVERNHVARQYGTPAVGWASMGALAIAEHRAVQQSIAKGVATKTVMSRIPGGGAMARVGNRLLWVALFDVGMRYFIVEDDYEAWVNQRVTDIVYEKDNVYELWAGEDFVTDGLFNWIKPIRGGTRWLAPSAMEWGVTMGNSAVETSIRRKDQMQSFDIKKDLKNILPTLALNREFEPQVQDTKKSLAGSAPKPENLPAIFDFAALRQVAEEPTLLESSYWSVIEESGVEEGQKQLNLSDEEFDRLAQKVLLKNFQDSAAFLVFVPGPQNDWAREVFFSDGTLRPGQEENLLKTLYGPKKYWGAHALEMERSFKKNRKEQKERLLAHADFARSFFNFSGGSE